MTSLVACGPVFDLPFMIIYFLGRIVIGGLAIAVPFKLISMIGEQKDSRRMERVRRNQCVGCGYDMRATPFRCPECGMIREQARVMPHKRAVICVRRGDGKKAEAIAVE